MNTHSRQADPQAAVGRVRVSRNQRRYVMAELSGAGSYMIGLGHRVEGPVDLDAVKFAFEAVVARHDALRTSFTLKQGEIEARVASSPRFRFETTQSTGRFQDFRAWAVPLVFQDVDVGDAASMVRLLVATAGDHWRFTVAMHHAITDGFSRGKVNEEFLKTLAGERLDPAGSYYSYASPPGPSGDAETLVAGFPDPVRIPEDGNISEESGSHLGHFVERTLTPGGEELKRLSTACGTSKFGVLTALYGLGLSAYTRSTNVSTWFQTEGRQALAAPLDVVGPFSNTLPLDLSHEAGTSFAAYARALKGRFGRMVENETAPLMETLLEQGNGPFVSINKFPSARPIRAGDLTVGAREFLDRRTEYDLNLVLTEEGDRVVARAFHDAQRLSEDRADAFLDLQDRLFAAALRDPEATCAAILAEARKDCAVDVPAVDTSWEGDESLWEAFERTATRVPDAPALRTSGARITYSSLRRQAEGVAKGLRAASADLAYPVAIHARRGPAMVAAMLGVSLAGGTFALVDEALPEDRVREMLATLGARAMIPAGGSWPAEPGQVTLVQPGGTAPVVGLPSLDRPAYALFTSGTTGRPKAVMHRARSLLRFIRWEAETLALDAPVTLMLAGLSHDPVMRDIFLPLSTGGTVVIPSEEEIGRPEALARLAREAGVSVLHATPATARLLSMSGDALALRQCRAVFWGGDTVPPGLVSSWRGIAPEARQWNLYGATETPQAALIAPLTEGVEQARRIPVGHPMPWTGLRIVDGEGRAVGPGEPGEIVIDLPDPVEGARALGTGEGMSHRTGDLGFWLPARGVIPIGRADAQVKINGHRIEPAGIAAVALQVPAVEAAECLVAGDRPTLHLFVAAADASVVPAVRAALARQLPAYMRPESVHVLDRLPLTRNGKVDRAALVQGLATPPATQRSGVAPAGAAEQAIAALYARTSGLEVTRSDMTLADLGTDSLGTIETRMELERRGLVLPQGWEWLSVAELARLWPETERRANRSLLELARLDSFILLRTLAIVLIVSEHGMGAAVGGGSTLLVALAGFAFGRLQLPSILADGQTGRVWALMAKIAIPLIPVALVIYLVHTVALGRDVDPSAILLYENLSPFMALAAGEDPTARHHIIWLWFLHAYLQMFLLVGLALSFRSIRERLARDPWRVLLVAIVLMEAVAILTVAWAGATLDDFGSASAVLRRWPTTLMPLLLIGLLAAQAYSLRRRAIVASVLAGHAVVVGTLLGGDEYLWVAGLLFVLALPSVRLPRALTIAAVAVSANALMIYLSHKPLEFALELTVGHVAPVVYVAAALAVGILAGRVMRPILDRMGVNRLARTRLSF